MPICFCTWWLRVSKSAAIIWQGAAARAAALPRLAKYCRMSTPMTTAPVCRSACAMLMTPSSQPPSPERKIATLVGLALRDVDGDRAEAAAPADAWQRCYRPAAPARCGAGLW